MADRNPSLDALALAPIMHIRRLPVRRLPLSPRPTLRLTIAEPGDYLLQVWQQYCEIEEPILIAEFPIVIKGEGDELPLQIFVSEYDG